MSQLIAAIKKGKTMDKYEKLKNKYKPIIQKYIDSNKKFYQFKRDIEWQYIEDKDDRKIASCNKRTLVISVNIVAVEFYMEQTNQPLTIEYFILHEIRHLFQYLCIYDYKTNPNGGFVPQASLWAQEVDNYIDLLKDNFGYYYQNIEFDAFCFSFAVMVYKYGIIDYIFAPHIYDNDIRFYNGVQTWINHFKQNNY